MSASPPRATILRALRKSVKSNFDKFGGSFTHGKEENLTACGVYKGHTWTLSYRILRASNGEVALLPVIDVDGVVRKTDGFSTLQEELRLFA